VAGRRYYEPSRHGLEARVTERAERIRAILGQSEDGPGDGRGDKTGNRNKLKDRPGNKPEDRPGNTTEKEQA
jgi:hypothetical protein